MKKTWLKVGALVVALALVSAGAYFVGRNTGGTPSGTEQPAAASHMLAEEEPNGLNVSHESMTLKVLTDSFPAGTEQTFAFQILQHDGTPLVKYQAWHEKIMHLIVVRRDLTNFQHLHPNLGRDGVWRVPLTIAEAGEYRVFADYMPLWGIHNEVLGADVSVSGTYQPRPLQPPTKTASVDGYTVSIKSTFKPGQPGNVTLTFAKDGKLVTDLEPYLGSYGHLIALRNGDLSYLHLHSNGTPGDGKTKPGPELVFSGTIAAFGEYGMFLDFQHQGVVRTAAFTLRIDGPNPPPHGLTEEQFAEAKAKNEKAATGGGMAGNSSGGMAGHG